jgi:hypothetical protein
MHWGAALAGSITDLSWDSDLFFCFTFWIGDEFTPCEMHPFFSFLMIIIWSASHVYDLFVAFFCR